MTPWSELLTKLAGGPRENGTAAIRDTAEYLRGIFEAASIESRFIDYTAYPNRLRMAGIVILVGTLFFSLSLWMRRAVLALIVAAALPILLLVELDYDVPIFGSLSSLDQKHIEASIPSQQPEQVLIFAAHFDSKTDLLDHVERVPIDLLALPITLLMILTAVAGMRRAKESPLPLWTRGVMMIIVFYGVGACAALSGGALLTERSHGAMDNGGACGVLVRFGELLKEQEPLKRTDIKLLFLSGEEIGVQGSWEYAKARFAQPPSLPTGVINLEFVGAEADLAVFKSERFTLNSYPADPELLRYVDKIHRSRRGEPVHVTWYGASTDARSFLAHGIPALTIFNDLPQHALARDMHTAADRKDRIKVNNLDHTVGFLVDLVRAYDAGPP